MSSEMVSGPDLGGGYLHQLSLDIEGEATTFTFHAQDGGSDAGGPAKGPLGPFGFIVTETPCMFGGPRCWHRRFLLGRRDAGRVRQAYNRHRFVLETMLAQQYDRAPVALAAGVRELLLRLSEPLEREGLEWYIGGSTAAWLQGAQVEPRDIDLGTTRAGVDRIAELLGEYLIEPLGPTDWPRAGIVRGARAFVGSFREGVRVEWSAPLEAREPRPYDEWSGRAGVARIERAEVEGRVVRVSRMEYALVRAAEKGNVSNVRAIVAALRSKGLDRSLLRVLLDRSALSADQRAALAAELGV